MRAKKIYLKDTFTHIPLVVLQFEPIDYEFCRHTGFGTDLRIIVKFEGKRATCIAAYKFSKIRGRTFDDFVLPFESDGTLLSFGEILDQVSNILHLPDEINVEETRLAINAISHEYYMEKEIRKKLEDYRDHAGIRKVIYINSFRWIAIALIDVESQHILFQMSTSADRNEQVAKYLWIPVKEATLEEIKPFNEIMDFREMAINK